MRRVMLYGGCHAQVMRDYFVTAYDPNDVEVDLVVNFELIRSGEPFPAERLAKCDALVYSPIENKGAYNTAALKDQCRGAGKLDICFPWLEWHGYNPGATKGLFKSRHQWFYPDLIALAESFDEFESFRDYVIEHYPSDEVIDRVLRLSTERLIASEDRHFASVRLSNLVESHHRTSRLFLIPDHPARTTYEHIIRQVVEQLGLPFRPEALVREPQWQCRTPIFPRVANRLGLAFDDQGWADDMLMPNHSSDLDTYLRLYFYADSVILAPIRSAAVLESGEPIEMSLALSSDTRVLAAPIDLDEHSYRFLTTLAGPPVTLAPLTEFSIDTSHWRQTWDQ